MSEFQLSKDSIVGEILRTNPMAGDVLMMMGLSCTGCPMAQRETLEQACQGHGVDLDKTLAALQALLGM